MEDLHTIDNPYAAPAADDPAFDRAPSERLRRLATAAWLAGMGVCGSVFAADQLLAFRFASASVFAAVVVGVCLSSLGAVGMSRSWPVRLGLVFLFFVGVLAEFFAVSTVEMMLKGIGRFG